MKKKIINFLLDEENEETPPNIVYVILIGVLIYFAL